MANEQENEDRLLDHEYDGIREYDNPMPRWWLWTFYATIAYVPIYYFAPLPFGEGPGVVAEYEMDIARHLASRPPEAAPVTDEAFVAFAQDPAMLAEGQQIYVVNCSACHRLDAGGLIGPNLTDDAWIHGGAPKAIHHSIAEGVIAKGMPGWGRILKPAQVDAVTAYVISLKGSNPPSPKAPEGKAEPAVVVGETRGS